jgi:hypothetical protein
VERGQGQGGGGVTLCIPTYVDEHDRLGLERKQRVLASLARSGLSHGVRLGLVVEEERRSIFRIQEEATENGGSSPAVVRPGVCQGVGQYGPGWVSAVLASRMYDAEASSSSHSLGNNKEVKIVRSSLAVLCRYLAVSPQRTAFMHVKHTRATLYDSPFPPLFLGSVGRPPHSTHTTAACRKRLRASQHLLSPRRGTIPSPPPFPAHLCSLKPHGRGRTVHPSHGTLPLSTSHT